jgi:hypothetical protein
MLLCSKHKVPPLGAAATPRALMHRCQLELNREPSQPPLGTTTATHHHLLLHDDAATGVGPLRLPSGSVVAAKSSTRVHMNQPTTTALRCRRRFPRCRERFSVDRLIWSSSDPADTTTTSAHVLRRSPTSPTPPVCAPPAPHRCPLGSDRVLLWDRLCGQPSSPIHLKRAPYPAALL